MLCYKIAPEPLSLLMNILRLPGCRSGSLETARDHMQYLMFPDAASCWFLRSGLCRSCARERRHLCLRDTGEVPCTSLRLFSVLISPLGGPVLGQSLRRFCTEAPAFAAPNPHLKTQKATQNWACLTTREGLGLGSEKKAGAPSAPSAPLQLLPASQASRRATQPMSSLERRESPAFHGSVPNEGLVEVGRGLCPPL